jgi:hypothetical protein
MEMGREGREMFAGGGVFVSILDIIIEKMMF